MIYLCVVRRWYVLSLICLLLAGCNRDPQVLRAKCVASGNQYFQKGKYRQASILYRRALQLDPKYAEAHYRLGITEMALGQYPDAVQSFQRAWDLNPANEDAAVRLGVIYLGAYVHDPQVNRHALEDARLVIERVLKRDPKSYQGLRMDADLATASNDRDRAIRRLREANEVKPWQPEVIVALMRDLNSAGQPDQAEKLGQEFLTHRKTFGPVYDVLYSSAIRKSEYAKAEAILKTKIANLPADASSRIELAGFYYSSNRRPEMLAMLDGLRADRKAFPQADGQIGDFEVRIGDYESALRSYREGEKNQPKLRATYEKRIAEVLIGQGKNEDALQIAARLHKENPDDLDAAALEASLLAKGNPRQVQSAIDKLEVLASKAPGNPVVQLNLGRAFAAKGDRDSLAKARQHLETSLNLNRDFVPAELALAGVQLELGENASAVRIAEAILKNNPANLRAELARATGLANMGETQKAREELIRVLDNHRGSNDARSQLAWLDLANKRYREAEAGFRTLVQAGDPRGIPGLAKCKQAQGEFAAAIQLLESELAKFPNRDDYRMGLAEIEIGAKRFQDARAQLEQLAGRHPDSAEIYQRLGDVENHLGDRAAAIQSLRKAHQLNPADYKEALSLAVLQEAAGEMEQARAAYEDVLKIDPENTQALNNLAYMKADEGVDLDRALGLAQRALQRSPNDPNISDTLGLIYIRKKLTGPAVEILRDLVTRAPANPSFHLHLAMALYDAGDKQKAKKELDTARKYKPSADEEAKIKEWEGRLHSPRTGS